MNVIEIHIFLKGFEHLLNGVILKKRVKRGGIDRRVSKRVDAEAYPDRQRDGQENHPDHAQAKPRALERKLLLTQRDTPFPIRF